MWKYSYIFIVIHYYSIKKEIYILIHSNRSITTRDNREMVKYNRWQSRICKLSVQLYSYVTSFNSFMCPTKLLIIVIIKCSSLSKVNALLYSLFSFFTLFYLILMNNWFISMLPPIILDILFGHTFINSILNLNYIFCCKASNIGIFLL